MQTLDDLVERWAHASVQEREATSPHMRKWYDWLLNRKRIEGRITVEHMLMPKPSLEKAPPPPMTIPAIKRLTAYVTDLSWDYIDASNGRKTQDRVRARAVAAVLLREELGLSNLRIAQVLGLVNHTTVVSLLKRWSDDKQVRAWVEEAKEKWAEVSNHAIQSDRN